MQTYKFSELDQRGQDAAHQRYCEDQIVIEEAEDILENSTHEEVLNATSALVFERLGWRFNEHGERIA